MFIRDNTVVNLHFNVKVDKEHTSPVGLAIRAVMVYTNPDSSASPVNLCYQHAYV